MSKIRSSAVRRLRTQPERYRRGVQRAEADQLAQRQRLAERLRRDEMPLPRMHRSVAVLGAAAHHALLVMGEQLGQPGAAGDHLRTEHGIEPIEDDRAAIRHQHMEAHGAVVLDDGTVIWPRPRRA